MNFNIGDRVKVKSMNELPVDCTQTAITNVCERTGKIVDAFESKFSGKSLYSIHFDNNITPYRTLIREDCLELEVVDPIEYTFSIEVDGTVVVAIMHEVKGSGVTEVARGHGHVIHAGALGIAQAASWADKKVYDDLRERNGI